MCSAGRRFRVLIGLLLVVASACTAASGQADRGNGSLRPERGGQAQHRSEGPRRAVDAHGGSEGSVPPDSAGQAPGQGDGALRPESGGQAEHRSEGPQRAVVTTTTPPPPTRSITDTGWAPFATVGRVVLTHPAALVERVGFHESNHDGARELVPAPTAASAVTLESRERGTGGRSAADVVVAPDTEIRSPVSGRVKRAGRYVLYCKHSDDFAVIAPDSHPQWEVKLLHIDGVRVRAGDRVVAGQTVLAPRATQLPFESQVDELRTVDPAWPHVHIEVVDPAIRDRPSPGGGC